MIKNLSTYLIVGFLSIVMISCGDDDPATVSGCTNVNADNYNSNATSDDGSCTFQNRYVASWSANIECPGQLSSAFSEEDVIVTADMNNTSMVIVAVPSTIAPGAFIPLNGTITENSIDVSQSLENIETNLPGIGMRTVNINITGQLTLSNDGTMLSGPLMVNIQDVNTNITISDTCQLTATKQ